MSINKIPNDHDAEYPVDAFFAEVIKSVRQREQDVKRRRLRNKQTFTLPEAAALTGLSAPGVFKLIDDQEIEANETRHGWRLIPREDVCRLVRRHAEENNCQAGLEFLAAIDEEETEVQ